MDKDASRALALSAVARTKAARTKELRELLPGSTVDLGDVEAAQKAAEKARLGGKTVPAKPVKPTPTEQGVSLGEAGRGDERVESKQAGKKRMRENERPTAGPDWYNLGAPIMTPELERELRVLRSRHWIDPSRHYKTRNAEDSKLPKYFAIGTLQASKMDPASKHLSSKRARKSTIMDTFLSDPRVYQYTKKKSAEAEANGRSAGKGAYRKKVQSRYGSKGIAPRTIGYKKSK